MSLSEFKSNMSASSSSSSGISTRSSSKRGLSSLYPPSSLLGKRSAQNRVSDGAQDAAGGSSDSPSVSITLLSPPSTRESKRAKLSAAKNQGKNMRFGLRANELMNGVDESTSRKRMRAQGSAAHQGSDNSTPHTVPLVGMDNATLFAKMMEAFTTLKEEVASIKSGQSIQVAVTPLKGSGTENRVDLTGGEVHNSAKSFTTADQSSSLQQEASPSALAPTNLSTRFSVAGDSSSSEFVKQYKELKADKYPEYNPTKHTFREFEGRLEAVLSSHGLLDGLRTAPTMLNYKQGRTNISIYNQKSEEEKLSAEQKELVRKNLAVYNCLHTILTRSHMDAHSKDFANRCPRDGYFMFKRLKARLDKPIELDKDKIMQEYEDLTMKPGEAIADFIDRAANILLDLSRFDIEKPIRRILNHLNGKIDQKHVDHSWYRGFIIHDAKRYTDESGLTIYDYHEEVRTAELQLDATSSNKTMSFSSKKFIGAAATQAKPSRTKFNNSPRTFPCQKCFVVGHRWRECKGKAAAKAKHCGYCDQYGHLEQDCAHKKKGTKMVPYEEYLKNKKPPSGCKKIGGI